MLPFRKILFPVDYSSRCHSTVPYVKDAVDHFKAELTLVHAYGPKNLLYDEIMEANQGWPEKVQTFESKRLASFAAHEFEGHPAQLRVAGGEAAFVINDLVRSEGTDLVMMPTRGCGPVRQLLIGSVTAKVLHDVDAAVWTGIGRELGGHELKLPYKSIVCALDGSEEEEAVLRAAASLARSYRAELSLITVVLTPAMAAEMNVSVYVKDLEERAHQRVRDLKSKLGIEAPHAVVSPPVIDALLKEVRIRAADLLVVGRGHARRAFGQLWSTLYSTIRDSPCPVLSI